MKIVYPSTIAALALCFSLVGCESWVHKVDVQQGNIIDEAAVEKIQVGMDKRQVRFLLGSPAITDAFHANRWDYVYYLKPGRGDSKLESLSIYFTGDRVDRLERRPVNGATPKG